MVAHAPVGGRLVATAGSSQLPARFMHMARFMHILER